MKSLQKLLQRAAGHYRSRLGLSLGLSLALLLAVLALLGMLALSEHAEREANERKSLETLQFEQSADRWLAHQQNVAQFQQALDSHALTAIALDSDHPGLVLYTSKDGQKASTIVPGCTAMGCAGTILDRLGERGGGFVLVPVHVDPRPPSRRVLDDLQSLLTPVLLMAAVILALFLGIRLQVGMGGAAPTLVVDPATRFADAIGNEEAKAALNRVKAFMSDPQHYARLGACAPRGVLLTGPPGTGKTLLARALAAESQANFVAVDGSYFTSKFYGAGVGKVKQLFRLARSKAPCVLFIDEVDGIGKRSRGELAGAESELNRIINRLLVEMDGFEALDNVVVVAATNHEENIDEAMLRPGRFDMVVRLTLPTLPERQRLFELYIGKLAHDGAADTLALARMTPGLSPAEIANIVNQAASAAAEARAERVGAEHLMRAIETHQLGGEVSAVKSLMTQGLRERLAYHESGHALVGHWLQAGVVERITIEPRGQALGVTYISRDTEDPLYKQSELGGRLAMMLAGRESELLVFDSVSSGASDDLKRASELAIQMVGTLGFSTTFGLLSVAGVPEELLGPDIQAAVLTEARALLERGQASCRQLLRANRAQLDALAQRLLACEVLAGEELVQLLGARAPPVPV
jgi:cell division protease FtsH